MVDRGATTIWERWDGWTAEHGFASPWMNSFNHYSLGSVGEWLYRFLLGIDQEPDTADFGRLLLRPHPGGSLDWARGSYESVRGTIRAGWKRDRGRFTYCTGAVHGPSGPIVDSAMMSVRSSASLTLLFRSSLTTATSVPGSR